MKEGFLKRLLTAGIFVISCFLWAGCEVEETSETSETPPEITVYEDNFDRADGSVGTDWTLASSGYISIVTNELRVRRPMGNEGSPVLYATGVEWDSYKITVKARITSAVWGRAVLIGGYISDTYTPARFEAYLEDDGDGDKKLVIESYSLSGFHSVLAQKTQTLTLNGTYIMELIFEGTAITFNIKNSSGEILDTLTATASRTASGRPGLGGGVWNSSTGSSGNIYFDDFRIEKL